MGQVQCPNCRSTNVSKTATGKVTSGAKDAGTVAAMVGGHILGEAVGISIVGKAASSLGKWALSYAPVEYVCNACDSLFTATFSTEEEIREISLKKPPLPEVIIEEVRTEYIQTIKNKRPYVATIIFALLTLYCYICMFLAVADDNGFQIFLSFIFAILFLIPTILKWKKIGSLNQEIRMCENQSARDFKHSHKGLFSKYKQFN